MPLHRYPVTLKTSALDAVSLNFEMICYGTKYTKGTKALAHYIHTEGYKQIEGPFTDWPASLLQELITALYRNRCGFQHLLHCAIQPQMTHCSISAHGNIMTAMSLLTKRCTKSLKFLEMNHSKNVPPGFCRQYFKNFRNITVLSVFDSMVDDSDFEAIGQSMPLLVELNAGRTWISNNGVRSLCLNPEQLAGSEQIAQFRCPKLVILNITTTRVSKEGVALFLACHPNAIRIEHEESFHALSFIRIQANQDYRCPMTNLMTTTSCLDKEDFNFAVDSCTLAEEVTILSSGLFDKNLHKLTSLSRLTLLHLGNKTYNSFNFYQGVAPVLTACGPTLKKLVLEDFTEIDIQVIGVSCPKLEHLALSGTSSFAPIAHINSGIFHNLKKLELWNRDNRWGCSDAFQYSVSALALKQLLFHSNIDYLLLYKVDTMTDSLFEDICFHNTMGYLHNVILDHCQSITSDILWKILKMPNALSVLRCWNCQGVPVQTRDKIKKVIKEENLMVYFEWYPFVENEEEMAAARALVAAAADWEEE